MCLISLLTANVSDFSSHVADLYSTITPEEVVRFVDYVVKNCCPYIFERYGYHVPITPIPTTLSNFAVPLLTYEANGIFSDNLNLQSHHITRSGVVAGQVMLSQLKRAEEFLLTYQTGDLPPNLVIKPCST